MTVMRETEFTSHGVTCRAWLCPPDSEALRNECGAPALVMAHGTSGVREQLKHYVPRFTAAGMHVLLFDYRHFGTSDGEPRQLLSIRRQLQDYAAALDVIRKVPGVDPRRVGIWGSSLAGGHVVDVAVTDGRVAAVVAQAAAMDNIATESGLSGRSRTRSCSFNKPSRSRVQRRKHDRGTSADI